MTGRPYTLTLNTRRQRVTPLDIDPTQALDEISTWLGYRATPLHALPGLASDLGVGSVWYKDEGARFGVLSFKPMGAGYAVARVVARHVEQETGRPLVTSAQLAAGPFSDLVADVTVACATDGNHGRAVAWAAQRLGCRAVVYLASHVSAFREEAIASFGADVIRTRGNHDEAVDRVAHDAKKHGWHIISETTRATDPRIAHDIFAGYSALAVEAQSGMPENEAPTHVFVQVGVGGLAAGCVQAFMGGDPPHPRIISVEAAAADSLRRSLASGERCAVEGELNTLMAGLAAGVVSDYVWPALRDGVFASLAVADEVIEPALRRLAEGRDGDPVIEAGESGVAGLAALSVVAGDTDTRAALELTGSSRVLVFGTEGVTDPGVFARLVGRPPSAPPV